MTDITRENVSRLADVMMETNPEAAQVMLRLRWDLDDRERKVDDLYRAANVAAEPLQGPTSGYYIACFKGGSRGYVCWWGPNNHGYTNDLSAAGVYDLPVAGYHDSGDDNVPVPVGFARRLKARHMVDIGDSGNECMWSAKTLRAALAKEGAARPAAPESKDG